MSKLIEKYKKKSLAFRIFVSFLVATLFITVTANSASAAGHWHYILQPSHIDRAKVSLPGEPFPFGVYFLYQVGSGCVHTDVIKYKEYYTGANDVHTLRHSVC